MATIQRSLSKRVDSLGKAEIKLRISAKRGCVARVDSGVFVPPSRFNEKEGRFVMPKLATPERAELKEAESKLRAIEGKLVEFCEVNAHDLTADNFKDAVKSLLAGNDKPTGSCGLSHWFDEYLKSKTLQEGTAKNYRVLVRLLERFDLYRRAVKKSEPLSVQNFTSSVLGDFKAFFMDEWKISQLCPQLYADAAEKAYKERSENTMKKTLRLLRAFFKWCVTKKLIDESPFEGMTIGKEVYGDVTYLTREERDHIAEFDLSDAPALAVQRDVFVFQCLIGCRVSDLVKLTRSNVVGNMLEYVAEKTKGHKGSSVRVPLCAKALEILARYSDRDDERLLPFICEQAYNRTIKELCARCGITRMVSIRDKNTGKETQKRICDIASSHLARRTFANALYQQGVSEGVIGKMTGHVEGSKAFARYRKADDEMLGKVIESFL